MTTETRGDDLVREARGMGKSEFRGWLASLSEDEKDDLELGLRRMYAERLADQARDSLGEWTPPRREITRTSSVFERAMAEIHSRLADEYQQETTREQ